MDVSGKSKSFGLAFPVTLMLAEMRAPLILGSAILFLAGCTHHSVRITASDVPDNSLAITEKVRPWPVTLTDVITIKIPNGNYTYKISDYEQQTNYPERPVKTIKSTDIELLIRGSVAQGIGGWISIYRDAVDIELLYGDQPATFNGKYSVVCPFIKSLP